MQSRPTNRLKHLFYVMFIVFILFFLTNTFVYAETGELKINNQVIYEKNESNQNNSTTFAINQLFMKDMSVQNQKINEQQITLITYAKKEVFMKELLKENTTNSNITAMLFLEDYMLDDSLNEVSTDLNEKNNIVIFLFGIVGGILILGLGILLGKSFSKQMKKI